jgi:hypothetical protein
MPFKTLSSSCEPLHGHLRFEQAGDLADSSSRQLLTHKERVAKLVLLVEKKCSFPQNSALESSLMFPGPNRHLTHFGMNVMVRKADSQSNQNNYVEHPHAHSVF